MEPFFFLRTIFLNNERNCVGSENLWRIVADFFLLELGHQVLADHAEEKKIILGQIYMRQVFD